MGDTFVLAPELLGGAADTPLAVSTDLDATWSTLETSCSHQTHAARQALFVSCERSGGMVEVLRWTPGQDAFAPFAELDLADNDGWAPLDDDRLLVKLGDDERIVTADGEQEIETFIEPYDQLNDVAALGDHLWVASFGAFQESLDGGKTWRPAR